MSKSNFAIEASEPMKDFLYYLQTVKGRSPATVDEYFNDLRTFFRFIKKQKRLVPSDTSFQDIKVDDVDMALISSVTLTDGYEFMNYLMNTEFKGRTFMVNLVLTRIVIIKTVKCIYQCGK